MPNMPSRGTPTPWVHKPDDSDVKELYNTHRWRRYRMRFLAVFPLCSQCERAASVVDHIVPARQRPELFWTASNHQALCTTCHQTKRATQD